jgi:hypothetical protein
VILALAPRAPVHAAQFDIDGHGGGWRLIRTTAGHPAIVAPHATPARVAPHPAGLTLALDLGSDGVAVLPAHGDGASGGAYVTLLRVRPDGSALALTLDGASYARMAPALVGGLDEALDGFDWPAGSSARPMLVARPRAARRVRDLGPAAQAVLGAILSGSEIRLGPGDAATRAEAAAAIADAIEMVPPRLRVHAPIAFGLARPDAAIQIAWSADAAPRATDAAWTMPDLSPDMTLAEAGSSLFADGEIAATAGASTASNPGPALAAKAAVAALARGVTRATTPTRASLAPPSLRALLDPAALDAILSAPAETRALAALVAAPDGALLDRLACALAVHAGLGGEGPALAARARKGLMPRDARAAAAQGVADARDLSVALDALFLDGAAPNAREESMIGAIAGTLVSLGRADVAFEAMRALSGRLARSRDLTADERLRLMSVVATLSSAVLVATRAATVPAAVAATA